MAVVGDYLLPQHTNVSGLAVLWTYFQANFAAVDRRKNQQHPPRVQLSGWYRRGLGRLLYLQNGRRAKTVFRQIQYQVAALDFLA